MPDDSVSDITDLEQDEILYKYYEAGRTKAEKRKMEREAARKRLMGEGKNVEQKAEHLCRGPRNVKYQEPPIELEIRQKSEGASMQDEEQSAHQFSVRDMSIQADDEER